MFLSWKASRGSDNQILNTSGLNRVMQASKHVSDRTHSRQVTRILYGGYVRGTVPYDVYRLTAGSPLVNALERRRRESYKQSYGYGNALDSAGSASIKQQFLCMTKPSVSKGNVTLDLKCSTSHSRPGIPLLEIFSPNH